MECNMQLINDVVFYAYGHFYTVGLIIYNKTIMMANNNNMAHLQ